MHDDCLSSIGAASTYPSLVYGPGNSAQVGCTGTRKFPPTPPGLAIVMADRTQSAAAQYVETADRGHVVSIATRHGPMEIDPFLTIPVICTPSFGVDIVQMIEPDTLHALRNRILAPEAHGLSDDMVKSGPTRASNYDRRAAAFDAQRRLTRSGV